MSFGPKSIFTQSIASGGSITPAYNLGRAWPSVYLVVPTMGGIATATCNIYVWGSADNTTFYQCIFPPSNTSTTAVLTFCLPNTISQAVTPIPNGIQYMKISVGNTATAGVAFSIICAGD